MTTTNYHEARLAAQVDANRYSRPMAIEKAREYGQEVFRVKMIPADTAKRAGWETRVEVVEPVEQSLNRQRS